MHAPSSSGLPGEATAEWLTRAYDDLRRCARRFLENDGPRHTLQPTALVHEAYLRLLGEDSWENRRHFFAAAARAMRHILVERARRYGREKHGGNRRRVEFGDIGGTCGSSTDDLLALDHALKRLDAQDRRMSDVVHLRYFAQFTVREVAAALGISPRSVDREWISAKAWLHREICGA